MFSFNDKLRNLLLDQGWDNAFSSPVLQIRSGSRPADAEGSHTGALLCEVAITTGTSGLFAAATSGTKISAGTWQGTAVAAGTPTWFRLMESGDSGTATATTPRLDGDIGIAGSLADLILATNTVALDDVVTINNFYVGHGDVAVEARAYGTGT